GDWILVLETTSTPAPSPPPNQPPTSPPPNQPPTSPPPNQPPNPTSPVPSPESAITNFVSYSGDFNKDGKEDILWRNVNTGDVYIWLMNGNSILAAGSLGNVDLSWKIVGIGDFDGGGRRDIVWYNASIGEVAIWVMNGLTRVGNYGFSAPISATG